MKIAHLILTHKNPAQLERLIHALEHPGFDFFIHVDKKSDIQPFLSIPAAPASARPAPASTPASSTSIPASAHTTSESTAPSVSDPPAAPSGVYMIKDRVPVYWAGFGTIQATINGFREILARGGYDYINVISGQDFPLKRADHIYEYIRSRQGQEFITCESIDGPWNSASRIRQYHLINWRIPGKFRLEKWVNRILPPRKFPVDHEIVGRANWFTLTTDAVKFSLDFLQQHPEVIRFYKYCWGADEFVFSTILFNSPFRDKIVDNLVYVDWAGQIGHPRMLRLADFPTLRASEKLFARKIDMEADPDLFGQLEKWIGADNN